MITTTIQEFMSGRYPDTERHELYALKNNAGNGYKYIGISKDVWHRWFSGSRSHMAKNVDGCWMGNSPVGDEVVKNMPESLGWEIELWTLKDCVNMFSSEISRIGYVADRMDSRDMERMMIRAFSPIMNRAY